ncbi:hypothetical protein KC330_g3787 [Hortaea werneckii]|nr:hypothetical protein KC330_g3787 [Hortaea werneckii]
MYAGAGFHNTGKDESSSPSLETSQRSAKDATAEPSISPSRCSETTGTADDDAGCSDDFYVPLLCDRPNTTQPIEHYVYEVYLFRALFFLVDRALKVLTSLMGDIIEVVEIPKQRHSKGRDVPYTELSDFPPSREKMRWQNVIMQLQPSSTPEKTEQVFMEAIDSFEFDAAVTPRQIIRPLSQMSDNLAN